MSAFIVSEYHLDSMLSFFNLHQGTVSLKKKETGEWYALNSSSIEDLQIMKQILADQNYRSVNERYQETEPAPVMSAKVLFERVSPVQIIKACNCYDYQACETDDYQQTDANRICDAIRASAIDELPGYEEAQWEMNEPVKVS